MLALIAGVLLIVASADSSAVDYSVDSIEEAVARQAGIVASDEHVRHGCRSGEISFRIDGDSLWVNPDIESLYARSGQGLYLALAVTANSIEPLADELPFAEWGAATPSNPIQNHLDAQNLPKLRRVSRLLADVPHSLYRDFLAQLKRATDLNVVLTHARSTLDEDRWNQVLLDAWSRARSGELPSEGGLSVQGRVIRALLEESPQSERRLLASVYEVSAPALE